jgi:hypothetical protein
MKRAWVVLGLLAAVQSASAAIQYEFRQSARSDVENQSAIDFSGRAVIDGDRSRVEFLSGNAYTPGTYLIATNGSRTLTFVDPAKKSYVEVNAGSVVTAIGAAKISIANKKVDTTLMDDHPTIAGLPTDHYRLTLSYDITLAFGTLPLTQTVHTIIDKWVTRAFGDVAETFLAGGALKTGNPDLDDLIDTENTKVKGFALRQMINVTTINNTPQVAKQLPLRRTSTQTREITVTSIESKATLPTTAFVVPAGYHKADPLRDDTQKAPLTVLSMEPPSGN